MTSPAKVTETSAETTHEDVLEEKRAALVKKRDELAKLRSQTQEERRLSEEAMEVARLDAESARLDTELEYEATATRVLEEAREQRERIANGEEEVLPDDVTPPDNTVADSLYSEEANVFVPADPTPLPVQEASDGSVADTQATGVVDYTSTPATTDEE